MYNFYTCHGLESKPLNLCRRPTSMKGNGRVIPPRTNSDKCSNFGPFLIPSHTWNLYLHFTSCYNNSMTMCWIIVWTARSCRQILENQNTPLPIANGRFGCCQHYTDICRTLLLDTLADQMQRHLTSFHVSLFTERASKNSEISK